MAKIKRDFLPEHLEPLRRDLGIVGSVAVQACAMTEETDWLLGLTKSTPEILGVVGWADFLSKDFPEHIERWTDCGQLRGLRAMLQDMPAPGEVMQSHVFGQNIKHLQEAGLVFDVLLKSSQLTEAFEFCKRHEKHSMVLDHGGKPDIKNGEWESWIKKITELARLPHLSCKLSGLVTEAEWLQTSKDHIIRYAEKIIELFGPDRVLFGSDWPVCTLAAPYNDVFEIADMAMQSYSPLERGKMFFSNAVSLYNLKIK